MRSIDTFPAIYDAYSLVTKLIRDLFRDLKGNCGLGSRVCKKFNNKSTVISVLRDFDSIGLAQTALA